MGAMRLKAPISECVEAASTAPRQLIHLNEHGFEMIVMIRQRCILCEQPNGFIVVSVSAEQYCCQRSFSIDPENDYLFGEASSK